MFKTQHKNKEVALATPKFVLQVGGDCLTIEKYACRASDYPYVLRSIHTLKDLQKEKGFFYVPVGSVEFTQAFCDHFGLSLPKESITYSWGIEHLIKRPVRRTTLGEAGSDEFVKPVGVKCFTGEVKSRLRPMNPNKPVWASPYVPFESEFRFYIHNLYPAPQIVGWARYDDTDYTNPDPDLGLVSSVMEAMGKYGPGAYSVDIGWRADLQQYDIVELNDAWALGLYRNTDKQSNPPSNSDYAEMLISRWRQILFCNLP